MGLRYSYELVAPRDGAERLVRTIVQHLIRADRARLLAALNAGVDKLMQAVERCEYEYSRWTAPAPVCLLFLFPSDEHLVAYLADRAVECEHDDPDTNRIRIGGVWGALRCGEEHVHFRATAATSRISLLFEKSPSIRNTFVQIGSEAGASLVVFDDEETFIGIWPKEGSMKNSPGEDEYLGPEGNSPLIIDRHCKELLAGVASL